MEPKENLPPPVTTELNQELGTNALPLVEIPSVGEKETGEALNNDNLVLVVDDVTDNVVLLSLLLQGKGYRVVTANDGEEAVRVAELARPQMILMDIGMPLLDGLGATTKIRADPNLRSIPIIAVTAFNTSGFRRAAYDVGFDGYVTKPIDFELLHNLITSLLNK